MEENPPVAVFKLGEKDHMAQLLNEGHVFMRPLLDFKTADLQPHYALVEYVDKNSYAGPMGAFRKYSHYSDQKELRVAAMPGTGRPLSLYLGNLSDIAIMGQTNERLVLDTKPPTAELV
jgi:hypothetical protein